MAEFVKRRGRIPLTVKPLQPVYLTDYSDEGERFNLSAGDFTLKITREEATRLKEHLEAALRQAIELPKIPLCDAPST